MAVLSSGSPWTGHRTIARASKSAMSPPIRSAVDIGMRFAFNKLGWGMLSTTKNNTQ